MADITNLNQTANELDRLAPAWINSVAARVKEIDTAIASANSQINALKSQVSQAFRVSPISGLNVQYAGGQIKLSNANVANIQAGQITLSNNAITYIYINDQGAVLASLTRPGIGQEVAKVTTLNGNVTDIINYPLFEVRPALPDFSDFATVDYANSRAWQLISVARKVNTFSIPGTDTYYTIPFESLKGTGFNTNGLFTMPTAIAPGRLIFHPQIRVDTTSPLSSPDLSVKLSLFAGNDELGLPLAQFESARGDMTINASNAEPVLLTAGQQCTIRVYLTIGRNARVRENSVVSVWRLPD